MPVVPKMDKPPFIPRRPFHVFSAKPAPSGTETSTTIFPLCPCCAANNDTASLIISRGFGLIAGSPTASGNPGNVTVPTPSPAWKDTPLPIPPSRTVTTIKAPWVTSGSSPASFTMPTCAYPLPFPSNANGKNGLWPFGSDIPIGSGNAPVRRAVYAAFVAAKAQAPVVHPRRSGFLGLSIIISLTATRL